MPEGPEVLDYFKFVQSHLQNKSISNISILSGKYSTKPPQHWQNLQQNLPNKVKDIIVKGKSIFILFENDISLTFTHGMTGWWDTHYDKHSRIQFDIGNKKLYYNDTRNFGTLTIHTTTSDFNKAINYLGPDVLNDDISFDLFFSRISKKPKSKIGAILLDQKTISGIGNYMRCDILWYAKIHYSRTVGSLTENEQLDLYNAVKTVCCHYLNCDPDDYFLIYSKSHDVYGNRVCKLKWLSRTIHFVNWN
jgi:DNA-formamidopyrimidine glycosylase